MLQIDRDLTTMTEKGLGRKDKKLLINERKELASKITANIDAIDDLKNDLADLQDDKDRLTNRDTRIGNRLESRLNNVSTILASEIANRKAVIDAISAGTTKENISKDLANLQKVNTMVSSLYPEVDKTEPVTINSIPPSKIENTTTTTPTVVEKAPAVEELTPVQKVEQINNARPIGMEITLNFGDTLYDGKRKLAEPVATEDPNGAMLVMTKDD